MLSPGINAKETSLQYNVSESSTGTAAIVGKFRWGPANVIQQVVNETDLVQKYGTPDNYSAQSFFCAQNFLLDGNDLRTIRLLDTTKAKNASALANRTTFVIQNPGTGYSVGDKITVVFGQKELTKTGYVTEVSIDGAIQKAFIPSEEIIETKAKLGLTEFDPVKWSVKIESLAGGAGAQITSLGIEEKQTVLIQNEFQFDTLLTSETKDQFTKHNIPVAVAKYAGEVGNDLVIHVINKAKYETAVNGTVKLNAFPSGKQYLVNVKAASAFGPENENQFLFVVQKGDQLVEQKVLQVKETEKDTYGNNISADLYFRNGSSDYVYLISDDLNKFTGSLELSGGDSGNNTTEAKPWMTAWDLFSDKENIEIDLLIAGAVASEGAQVASTVQKYVSALADSRMECLAIVDTPLELIVNKSVSEATDNIVEWRRGRKIGHNDQIVEHNMNINSTYTVIIGNAKYQYDKYNGINRWIPLAGDIAGLCVRTDNVSYPWMSPAGFKRGMLKNVIKLAIETREAHRDRMYTEGVNPVYGFASSGFILYGDKTATTIASPFDRINVRRLFNMLKRNISKMARSVQFEINDEFTRYSFRTEASGYLGTIQDRGGVYNFLVQCDETNNTPQVIDSNNFVASFWIQPARSINFIQLNFIATATGADFQELIGTAKI